MTNIAHISYHLYLAGAQRYVKIISEAGYGKLFIVAGSQLSHEVNESARKWFDDIGVDIVFASNGTEGVKEALESHDIDVVCSHSLSSDIWTYEHYDDIIGQNRKWAIMQHGRWLEAYRQNAENFHTYFPLLMQKVDRILDPCPKYHEPMLEQYSGDANILDKVRQVTYGAQDMEQNLIFLERGHYSIPPSGGNTVVFALFSRMIRTKGPHIAVSVISLLNQAGYDANLLLVGSGEEWDRLKGEEPDNVTFIPSVSNPQSCKNLFDIGIHPSTYPGETGPMAPLENSVMEKATLATDNANTGDYLGDTDLTVNWLDEYGAVLEDEVIANSMYTQATSLFYNEDKLPNWPEIHHLGETVRHHYLNNFTFEHIVAPYHQGALEF